ncbi:hypothetical protein CCACVL1_07614 [Corchorus capsularis]|uniref:Uncharacterized protein n=1 Tax=Corchorus capsularis TaxID=210143 RepID=A0A1R3J4T1_COCAP|nr:hypothetical protein CCACVL1_07614 [Corchorus capsularis]
MPKPNNMLRPNPHLLHSSSLTLYKAIKPLSHNTTGLLSRTRLGVVDWYRRRLREEYVGWSLSLDAPIADAISTCMLGSLLLPVPAADTGEEDGDSVIDEGIRGLRLWRLSDAYLTSIGWLETEFVMPILSSSIMKVYRGSH